MNYRKMVCSVGAALGAFPIGHALRRLRFGSGYIRSVLIHETPLRDAENFERQLHFLSQHFDNVGPKELEECLQDRRRAVRPGVLLTFDDGYRSNFEIAAPLLEKYGFTGWFFVSTGRLRSDDDSENTEFMNFAELRALADRGHVVGCHGHSHLRLSDTLSQEQLTEEILSSRARLEAGVGRPVETFCWIGGEEWSYGKRAYRLIADAGYRYAFMTNLTILRAKTHPLWLDRTQMEADWSMSQVRFYLSGIMDLAYRGKRQRLRRKLLPAPA